MAESRGKGPNSMVKDWLPNLLTNQQLRRPNDGWPDHASVGERKLFSSWLHALIDFKATDVEAFKAQDRFCEMHEGKDVSCHEHLPLMIAIIDTIRQEIAEAKIVPDDRELAKSASIHCEYCRGEGMLVVFDRTYDGHAVMNRLCRLPNGEVKTIPYVQRCSAHCVCPYGRWMREQIRRQSPELIPRIPDFAEVLAGSKWVWPDPTGDYPFDADNPRPEE